MMLRLIALFHLLAQIVMANKAFISGEDSQVCSGMYSKQDWSGPVDPYIKLNLKDFQTYKSSTKNKDIDVSIVIFEYRDIVNLGVEQSSGSVRYICDDYLIANGDCEEADRNKFVVSGNTTYNEIISTKLTSLGDNNITYHVKTTGYYCVASYSPTTIDSVTYSNTFNLLVNFQNAFGSLSASEIPKLPLYGLLAICYAGSLCIYLFQIFRHRSELLLLQKYLAGFFVFLTCENILIWSLYEVQNNNKKYPLPGGIKFYLFLISFLNSFKVTFSFFLLLIISLGYGIVYPKLNKRLMTNCKILAGVHFVFGVFYLSVNYITESSGLTSPSTSTTDQNTNSGGSYLTLFSTVPVAITMFVFYFLILSALSKTVKYLTENRQAVKLNMYKQLFRLIFGSLLMMIFALVVTTLLFFNDSVTNSIERFWKFNQVLMDFWPSALYFVVFLGIALIWRPTDTSYMLAVSQQIPQSDVEAGNNNNTSQQYGVEFELDDLQSQDGENPFADPDALKKSQRNDQDDDSIDFGLEEEGQSFNATTREDQDTKAKGKNKATASDSNTVFELGDVDDDEDGFEEWDRTTGDEPTPSKPQKDSKKQD